MTETETEEGGKAAPKRTPGKRARPPVTIDLAAEAAPPAAESPDAKSSAPAEDASSAKAAPPPSEPPPAAPGLTMTAGADQEPKAAADRTRPSAEPRPEAASSPSVVTAPGPVSPFPPRIERPKTDWSSAGRLIAAGVFGGAIATVLGILYHASGIIPTRADLVAADAVRKALPADAAVMVAAVADWRTSEVATSKMKKREMAPPALRLTENPDILANLAAGAKRPGLVVGFAAETDNVIEKAQIKRKRKGADWIVANDVSGDVMGGGRNTVHVVTGEGVDSWQELPKEEVARQLVEKIADALNQ